MPKQSLDKQPRQCYHIIYMTATQKKAAPPHAKHPTGKNAKDRTEQI
mgnify:CR=1 FL=1